MIEICRDFIAAVILNFNFNWIFYGAREKPGSLMKTIQFNGPYYLVYIQFRQINDSKKRPEFILLKINQNERIYSRTARADIDCSR